MTKSISLNTLWESATPTKLAFNPDKLSHLPAAAKRYLEHTIAPGTKIASAVRLKMHGEIKTLMKDFDLSKASVYRYLGKFSSEVP